MKRTVKAWAIRHDEKPSPGGLFQPYRHGSRYDTFVTREDAQKESATYLYERSIVRCTITYDDGQPKAKPRRKATRAGRGA